MKTGQGLAVPIDLGKGAPVVMLPGFALPPAVYAQTALLLAESCRVIIPDLYRVSGPWRFDDILGRFTNTLEGLGLDRVTLIGHSFAGSLELGFAARRPERVVELVFADTLAVSREWPLAAHAVSHPLRLLWMATPSVAASFTRTALGHPRQVAQAAWWGFRSGRSDDIGRVAASNLATHVLWANRDSLLSRTDGRDFAQGLHASFTIVDGARGKPVDHDWMYRHPRLFVDHIGKLDLVALNGVKD
jgi:pimeloyl-ACP methyl ester carboxylesterase